MKRLFCVKGSTDKVMEFGIELGPSYFESKMEAKKGRDSMEGAANAPYRVSRGPDHMGKHGQTNVPMMRRKPKHV